MRRRRRTVTPATSDTEASRKNAGVNGDQKFLICGDLEPMFIVHMLASNAVFHATLQNIIRAHPDGRILIPSDDALHRAILQVEAPGVSQDVRDHIAAVAASYLAAMREDPLLD